MTKAQEFFISDEGKQYFISMINNYREASTTLDDYWEAHASSEDTNCVTDRYPGLLLEYASSVPIEAMLKMVGIDMDDDIDDIVYSIDNCGESWVYHYTPEKVYNAMRGIIINTSDGCGCSCAHGECKCGKGGRDGE